MTTHPSMLRSNLEKLFEYHLPESLEPTSDVSLDDHNVAERYEKARNSYLEKRFQQVFCEHLGNFDGYSVPFPNVPSDEDRRELQEQHKAAQMELKETVALIYDKHEALQSRYDVFVSRREEIARMIADIEESLVDYDDDDDDDDNMDKQNKDSGNLDPNLDNNDDDVNEQDLVVKEQMCLALSKRKNELLLQLTRKKADIANQELKLAETESLLAELRSSNPDTPVVTQDSMADFEQEILDLDQQTRKYSLIKEWNDAMRHIVEELTGIEVLSVTYAEDGKTILLVVHLLKTYQLEIQLKSDLRQPNNLRVQDAKFLSSAIVKGASIDNTSRIELQIPAVHDLVRLCCAMGPVEDLRFLLRESIARITIMMARADELTVLRKKYLTKIGMLHHSEHTFGGDDQEIVCSINEGVTIVLRLTPDCPLANGSVYVDRLVGVGGWSTEILDDIKLSLNNDFHRSPIALMDALQETLTRLQKSGDVSLPKTPTLPMRAK